MDSNPHHAVENLSSHFFPPRMKILITSHVSVSWDINDMFKNKKRENS